MSNPGFPANRKPDNWLRAARFERPDHVPVACNVNASCWHHYDPNFLWEMIAVHPTIFPWFKATGEAERARIENPVFRVDSIAGKPYRDPWGCLWETTDDGIVGAVTEHPLSGWDALPALKVPEPDRTNGMFPVDWADMANRRRKAGAAGQSFGAGLHHGHTFLRLCDLRGYEALIFDMVDGCAELRELVDLVKTFNLAVLDRVLRLGPDAVQIPEDLGMQSGPMLSPQQFDTWLAPCYRSYVNRVRERSDALVHMHSDGDIRTLVPALLDIGMDILNLQDLVNGIEWIETNLKGKVCIDLDIDRQQITRFGTPAQIDALIKEAVCRLGSPNGGLMMIYGLYPGTPEANVNAVLDAMETYAHAY